MPCLLVCWNRNGANERLQAHLLRSYGSDFAFCTIVAAGKKLMISTICRLSSCRFIGIGSNTLR